METNYPGTAAQESYQHEHKAHIMEKYAQKISTDAYFWGMAASIVASATLFALGKRGWSLFVGLWAPTILNAGVLAKLARAYSKEQREGTYH